MPSLPGLTIHMCKNRYEKVYVQDADDLGSESRKVGLQMLQNGADIELKPLTVQGKFRLSLGFQQDGLQIQITGYMGGNYIENDSRDVPERYDADAMAVRFHIDQRFNPYRSIFLCNVTRLMPRILADWVMFPSHNANTSKI